MAYQTMQKEDRQDMLKVTFSDQRPTQGAVSFGVFQDNGFSYAGQSFDAEAGGVLKRALSTTYFKGSAEEILSVLACGPLERAILFGLGTQKFLSKAQAYAIGGSLVAHLLKTPHTRLTVMADGDSCDDCLWCDSPGMAIR